MTRAVAVEFRSPGKVGLTTIDVPAPRAGELLVRVRACGICMFDVTTFKGKLPAAFPRVAGHEGVGVVEQVGADVGTYKPGDKIAFLGGPALSDYCLVKETNAALIPPRLKTMRCPPEVGRRTVDLGDALLTTPFISRLGRRRSSLATC